MLFRLILVSTLFLGEIAQAQTSTDFAKVYLIRVRNFSHSYGSGTTDDLLMDAKGFHMFIDTAMVCLLNKYKFSGHLVPAGEHRFSARLNSKSYSKNMISYDLNMEPGKVYYIGVGPSNEIGSPLQCFRIGDLTGAILKKTKIAKHANKFSYSTPIRQKRQ